MDTIVILANGAWAAAAQARRLAASADYVIAADGGLAKALRASIRVDLVVGDFDSLQPAAVRLLVRSDTDVRRHPVGKDASDLELALDEALARRPRRVVIFGALGERIDHTLTNVHLLERGLVAGADIRLVDGRQTIVLVASQLDLVEARVGDTLSLLPLSETARVSTIGLRYPLQDEVLHRAASRGVSNEVVSVPASVGVADGRLLVIHVRGGAPQ